jgi:tetratricopeptide (TPR) repeat protein
LRFHSLLVLIVLFNVPAFGAQPKDSEYCLKKGIDHFEKGQIDEALKALGEAIRLDPKHALAFSSRGAIHYNTKQYDKAIADVDEAIRLEPSKATSGYSIRGNAWYMKKEYAKAVTDFDEAIRLDPSDPEPLNSRAWAAATCPEPRFRDDTMALKYAQRACKLDGHKNPFYLGTLAAAHAVHGDFENAVKWQRKALEDKFYLKESGDEGRKMLKLFEGKKVYRQEPSSK